MNRLALAIEPLLDAAPVDMEAFQRGSLLQRLKSLSTFKPLLQAGKSKGRCQGMRRVFTWPSPFFSMLDISLNLRGSRPTAVN